MRAPIRLLALAFVAALGACNRTPQGHTSADGGASVALPTGPQVASGLWAQRVSDSRGARETRYCLDAAAASTRRSGMERHLSPTSTWYSTSAASDTTRSSVSASTASASSSASSRIFAPMRGAPAS